MRDFDIATLPGWTDNTLLAYQKHQYSALFDFGDFCSAPISDLSGIVLTLEWSVGWGVDQGLVLVGGQGGLQAVEGHHQVGRRYLPGRSSGTWNLVR